MKKELVVLVLILLVSAGIVSACSGWGFFKKNSALISEIVQEFEKEGKVKVVEKRFEDKYLLVEIKYIDNLNEPPITVDFLLNIKEKPKKIIYLLPGSALNFKSNFFTPRDYNLAKYLADSKYLVIGITPREDLAIPVNNYEYMKNWGLEKHTEDVRKIISLVESVLPKKYEILGHSLGGIIALDYAAKYSSVDKKLKRVIVLDMVGEYENETLRQYAQISYDALKSLWQQGYYADESMADSKKLILMAKIFPTADSGFPRSLIAGDPTLEGNFTLKGLVYYMLIHTNKVPGVLTPITGLPDNWHFKQGFCSGEYKFDPENPENDTYELYLTNYSTIQEATIKIRSGVYPTAVMLDVYKCWSGNSSINWTKISVPVLWINCELGFDKEFLPKEIQEKLDVKFLVIPGYGHADIVYAENATDVWQNLI